MNCAAIRKKNALFITPSKLEFICDLTVSKIKTRLCKQTKSSTERCNQYRIKNFTYVL